jgi:DNA-binding NarL/FixJ family response regulator
MHMHDGPGGATVRVLIVDDHQMFAESIAHILTDEDAIEVIGIAANAADGIRLAHSANPDVVVLDLNLPDGDGIDVARRIRQTDPTTRVLILTGAGDERTVVDAVDAGCSGLVTKDRALRELVDAVRVTAAGDAYIGPAMLAALLPRLGSTPRAIGSDLTTREREVLDLMGEGLSNQAIADRMILSVHTIRNHVQNLLSKLHAHSKLEAVVVATRAALLARR